MKKDARPRLVVRRETLRALTKLELVHVVGGESVATCVENAMILRQLKPIA